MNPIPQIKNVVKKLNQYSPWPLFYHFQMTKDERKIFGEQIKNSVVYLEFGMGGSTLFSLKNSSAKIYTVESSDKWIMYMRKYFFLRYHENKRLIIYYVNIGITGEWGYPEGDSNSNLFPDYSSSIFNVIDGNSIDLVMIDGRFRVACTLKIILECYFNNKLKILIHDFWNREEYQVVLKYLDVIDRVDSLGVFSIREDIDLKLVNSDYVAYKFNPA